mgnify:FL=1
MKIVNRIKDSKDFAITIKQGKTAKNQSYVLHFVKTDSDHTRIGISVSKKIGNAVTRNRVKRQIRAMLDSLINYNLNKFDVVVIARQDFLNKNFDENKLLLSDLLLNQVGIKNEEEK